jgi:polyhydroxybutyrate depolymerase
MHALPLLVVLHGRGQPPWTAVRSTGFLPLARRDQAVLIYPDGLSRSWNAGSGCCGVAGIRGTPDTAFVAAVVADVLRALPVDPARVYLAGYSNGGKLAWSQERTAGGCLDSMLAVLAGAAGRCLADRELRPSLSTVREDSRTVVTALDNGGAFGHELGALADRFRGRVFDPSPADDL